jgi:hypothetical protein
MNDNGEFDAPRASPDLRHVHLQATGDIRIARWLAQTALARFPRYRSSAKVAHPFEGGIKISNIFG